MRMLCSTTLRTGDSRTPLLCSLQLRTSELRPCVPEDMGITGELPLGRSSLHVAAGESMQDGGGHVRVHARDTAFFVNFAAFFSTLRLHNKLSSIVAHTILEQAVQHCDPNHQCSFKRTQAMLEHWDGARACDIFQLSQDSPYWSLARTCLAS